jgi:hypothetical protein
MGAPLLPYKKAIFFLWERFLISPLFQDHLEVQLQSFVQSTTDQSFVYLIFLFLTRGHCSFTGGRGDLLPSLSTIS